MSSDQTRTYDRTKCIVFLKTNEAFGGLSNMAGGYPLIINGVRILTSEALYQVCRFPLLPEVQRLIIEQKSPMTAKMKGKPHRKDSRPDWDLVRVKIMRWCLRVKLAQNWNTFSKLLLDTSEKPIVEQSRKDDFWGAKVLDNQTLVGRNVLGRLLMELREAVKNNEKDSLLCVEPLAVPDFLLYGCPIQKIFASTRIEQVSATRQTESENKPVVTPSIPFQSSLFDHSPVKEASSTYLSAHQPKIPLLSNLKPYPEYKESGLSWLGKVPVHWKLIPAFGVFTPNHEKNRGLKEKTVLSLSYGRIVIKPKDKLHGLVPESFETYQIVNPGDIILRTTDLQNDHTSLRVGMVRNRGIITSAYLALKMMDGVIPEFGFQFLNVWDTTKVIYGYGSGLRQNLDFAHFKRMPVALPLPEEQNAIVRFLDWVNGRLGRTIKAKQKQIALLNEQKQVIIHHAVTRGLDQSLPLKPSGIPWLGEIPTHWDVRKLRTCAELIVSNVDKHSHAHEKTVRLCNYTNVYKNEHITNTLNFMCATATDEEILNFRIRVGDVVITKDSEEWDDIGVPSFVAYEDDDLVCGYHLAILRPQRDLVLGDFLFRALQDKFVATQMHISAKGVTRYGLSHQGIKDVMIPLPPKGEQMSICTTLSSDLKRFDIISARHEREIELLREYRNSLVADVVTGKLDVREAAAKLPEEEITDVIDVAEISDVEIAV